MGKMTRKWLVTLVLVWSCTSVFHNSAASPAIYSTNEHDGAAEEQIQSCGTYQYILGVAFSPDGKSILAGWKPGVARLWDLKTGYVLQTFRSAGDTFTSSVAFSPDGKYVLTGNDGEAVLWDIRMGAKVRTFPHNFDDPFGAEASFSSDGKFVLVSSYHGVALWNVETGKMARAFPGNLEQLLGFAQLSRDGKYVLTGDFPAGEWYLWDVQTGTKLRTFVETYKAAFTPDDKFILTHTQGSDGLALLLWEVRNPVQSHTLDTSGGRQWGYSTDGRYLLAPIYRETSRWQIDLALWDLRTYRRLLIFPLSPNIAIWWSILSSDGLRLIVKDESSDNQIGSFTVQIWDLISRKLVRKMRIDHSFPSASAFSKDGRYWLMGTDGEVHLWDLATGQKVRRYC